MIDLSTLSLEELVNIKERCEDEIVHRRADRLTELKDQMYTIVKSIIAEFPEISMPSIAYDEENGYIPCDALTVLLHYFTE